MIVMRKLWIVMGLIGTAVLVTTGVNTVPASGQSTSSTAWTRAWPMVGHDAQRTNRSSAVGPTAPRLLRSVPGAFDFPLIGPDNAVYALGGGAGLYAFSSNLQRRWVLNTGTYLDPYVLLPNGDLVISGFNTKKLPATNDDSDVIGVRSDGQVAWRIQPFDLLKGSAPLVTATGQTYLPMGGPLDDPYVGLIVLSLDGRIVQRVPRRKAGFEIALAPGGTVYEKDGTLRAYGSGGRLVWKRHPIAAPTGSAGLMVGAGGAVYAVISNVLFSYTKAGRLRWQYSKPDGVSTMAQRADGAIVLAGPRSLETVSAAGKRVWRRPLGNPTGWFKQSTLCVDAAGTAYVGTQGGVLRVFSSSGALLARLKVGPSGDNNGKYPAPDTALGSDGRLVVASAGSLQVYSQ